METSLEEARHPENKYLPNYGLFAPLPFRPYRRFAPCSFAPWLVRRLADSPTHRGPLAPGLFAPVRGIIAIRRQKLYAYNLLFILFQGFLFRLRLYKERQLYNSIIQESPANAKGTRDSSACMNAHCKQM